MRKIVVFGILWSVLFAFSGCSSSGEDEEELFYSVSGKINLTDKEYWLDEMELRFGIFKLDETIPQYSVRLNNPVGGEITFNLANIQAGDYFFKIYVSKNTINLADLLVYQNNNINSDLILSDRNLTLVTYERVQNQVFSSCLQCHGGSSGELAGGLSLMHDKSYSNLTNTPSENSELLRVKPFFVNESFLVKVLYKDGLTFDHPASINASNEDKKLVKNWISKGALEN